MKIAIVGSRNYADTELVRTYVRSLAPDTIVVSGGATGVDSIAVDEARGRGLEALVIPAIWGVYGKLAGPLRNAEIVAQADVVVAFWDGKSRGTLDTINKTKAAGKPLEVILGKVEAPPLTPPILPRGL